MASMKRLKPGIDELIGEHIWMTNDLARKMAKPRPKTMRTPVIAMAGILAIAAFLFTITSWSTQPGILGDSTINALGENGELFNTYFEAIDSQDSEKLEQVAVPAYGEAVDGLYEKYESMDFSTAEFLQELDGIIWMKYIVMNDEGGEWGEVATYYQIVDGKIYEPIYGHPFFIYKNFDMEKAQAQAVFGLGGYGRNMNQFVAVESGELLVSGHLSGNKVESTIDLYLKRIGEKSVLKHFEQPRLVYKDNGKVLWLTADGFEISFKRKGERILVDDQGVEYYQQGRF